MRGHGERIKALRQKFGINQKDLSKKLNIAQSSLSEIEKATYPPLNRIEQICDVFDIQLWEFFLDDPKELENYLPSYIKKEDAEMLHTLNTQIDAEMRINIKKIFYDILKSHLEAAGIKVNP